MKKSLRGTLRQSLKLCTSHWRGLAAASVLPFILASVVGTIQLWQMREIYAAALAANLAATPDAEAQFEAVVQGRGFLFLAFFIFNALILAWNFTRIVQFWKTGKAQAFGIQHGELHETAAIVVYGIFVGLALFAAYVMAEIVILLAAQALSILNAPAAAFELGSGFAAAVVLLLILGIAMRFLAGFPGIAQGGTPRPMRDLWPLARGLGFSLTWRAIAVLLAFVLVSVVLLVVFMLPMLAGTGSDIINPETHEIGPNAGRSLAAVLAPALVFGQWIKAAFLAYFATFLTVVFARLSGQDETLNK